MSSIVESEPDADTPSSTTSNAQHTLPKPRQDEQRAPSIQASSRFESCHSPAEISHSQADHYDRVSKRSVERLYHSKDPQLCKDFVSKPQRRSALVNRFYWLRTRAIDVTVQKFLEDESSNAPKAVINLGCGSDVLPWRHDTGNSDSRSWKNLHWIDVDYPKVIRQKATTVSRNPKLAGLMGTQTVCVDDPDLCLIQGMKYSLLGCDFMANFSSLKQQLLKTLSADEPKRQLLVVAEMSLLTYDTTLAYELLAWFRDAFDARICILSTAFPTSDKEHPFASSLLETNPQAAPYLSVAEQRDAYVRLGFDQVCVNDLWDIWSEDSLTPPAERLRIQKVEPFDEWEDFILWARHFCLIQDCFEVRARDKTKLQTGQQPRDDSLAVEKVATCQTTNRRYGALIPLTTPEGTEALIRMFGAANHKLLDSYDILSVDKQEAKPDLAAWGPPARTHFSLTDLGDFGFLLVGGRSRSKILSDSWIFRKGSASWDTPTPTTKFPQAVCRHSTVRLGKSGMALVLGGLTDNSVSDKSMLFHHRNGWRLCKVIGTPMVPVFGAVAWLTPLGKDSLEDGTFRGVICGGLRSTGTISMEAYTWIVCTAKEEPTITFERATADDPRLFTFGASTQTLKGSQLICGGIGLRSVGQDVSTVNVSGMNPTRLNVLSVRRIEPSILLGSAMISMNNRLVIVGGGAAAFASGHVNSTASYVLKFKDRDMQEIFNMRWSGTRSISNEIPRTRMTGSGSGDAGLVQIPRVRIASARDFEKTLQDRKPVVIEGLDFGPCLKRWSPSHMTEKVGSDTQVIVHEATTDSPKMDFNTKNFQYVTDGFGNIVSRMKAGGHLYLRSLSRSKPSEIPANLEDDFPALAADFALPQELAHARDNLFSSILRLSGRASMWLHYDVMANIYTQINGSKRMILFPPSSVTQLAFSPGASSSSLDVFEALEHDPSSLCGTKPHEALLGPGDALFLPAAWLHTATPLTDMSVAVNVFFRDLASGYAEGRDVYGNRDLGGYEKGRQDLKKILRSFKGVPDDLKAFYLKRLAQELEQLADA